LVVTCVLVGFCVLAVAVGGGFAASRFIFAGPANPSSSPLAYVPPKGADDPPPPPASKPRVAPTPMPDTEPALVQKPRSDEPPAGESALVLNPRSDDKPQASSDLDGKLETYLKLIKPHAGEWKFAQVPWEKTVFEARKKAAEQGKPLFIWYMAGEPLGQC
jgi:hypothetical protein